MDVQTQGGAQVASGRRAWGKTNSNSVIARGMRKLKSEGLGGVAQAIARRVVHRLPARIRRMNSITANSDSSIPDSSPACFREHRASLSGKRGLEIGGPSYMFGRTGLFPIYPLVGELDNCNFSKQTIWEGMIKAGRTFLYDSDRPMGQQYISEATNLSQIPTGTYDFVLSSHMLEHTANPLRALREWARVVREGGTLVVIIPRPEGTFDHRRPMTSLAHVVEDFDRDVSENDLTHLPEILELHDLELDPPAGDLAAFKARSLKNFENRCLHHHVFDMRLVEGMLDFVGLQIKAVEAKAPDQIFAIAEKLRAGKSPQNTKIATHLRHSAVAPLRARAKSA